MQTYSNLSFSSFPILIGRICFFFLHIIFVWFFFWFNEMETSANKSLWIWLPAIMTDEMEMCEKEKLRIINMLLVWWPFIFSDDPYHFQFNSNVHSLEHIKLICFGARYDSLASVFHSFNIEVVEIQFGVRALDLFMFENSIIFTSMLSNIIQSTKKEKPIKTIQWNKIQVNKNRHWRHQCFFFPFEENTRKRKNKQPNSNRKRSKRLEQVH